MRRCTFLITVSLVFFLASVSTNPCAAETLVYPMQYRTAAEVVPMVQALLSPGGRAVSDARTNALLVADDKETIERGGEREDR
jgi:type II secretory pathway component HofQ